MLVDWWWMDERNGLGSYVVKEWFVCSYFSLKLVMEKLVRIGGDIW